MKFEALYEYYPRLESDELILKKIEVDDIDDFYELHSNPEIFKYMPGKAKTNLKSVTNIIGHYERDFLKKKMVFLGIYLKQEDIKLVGIAEIFDIDRKVEMITIGYRLNPAYWGRGIATRCVRLMVNFLFIEVEVNRIQGYVMPENKKSGAVLVRNKFIHEGTLRSSQYWKDTGIVDLDVYSMLRDDYLQVDKWSSV